MPCDDNQSGWGMIDAFEAVHQSTGVSLVFSFPLGRPSVINPAGGTVILIVVTGQAIPEPDAGTLHVSTGGGFTGVPMSETAPGQYESALSSGAGLAPA